jgi:hypothetical protein
LAKGRDLRIPRDLSSIVTKQGQGHTTPLHLLGSHLLRTLFAHSLSRQTLGLQRCDLSILPQSQKENTVTDVATTHLGSQQLRIVPVQLRDLALQVDLGRSRVQGGSRSRMRTWTFLFLRTISRSSSRPCLLLWAGGRRGWFLLKESNDQRASHSLECLQDGQTFRLLLVIDIPSSAQHLLRSLAFLSRDEMETGATGEERRGEETNFVSNFQIDASSVLQQQRDDSGMTFEASEMETSISILREMRGDQAQATLTLS